MRYLITTLALMMVTNSAAMADEVVSRSIQLAPTSSAPQPTVAPDFSTHSPRAQAVLLALAAEESGGGRLQPSTTGTLIFSAKHAQDLVLSN